MNENRLRENIKEEIRISKEFLNQKRQEIENLKCDIRYYEGQIDALNLTISTLDKFEGEK